MQRDPPIARSTRSRSLSIDARAPASTEIASSRPRSSSVSNSRLHRILGFDPPLHRVPITGTALSAQRAALRGVTSSAVAPDLQAIRVQRGGAETPEQFTDLLADTRASISRLREQNTGRSMLNALQHKAAAVNPGASAGATTVNIRSGRDKATMRNGYAPRHNATYPSIQRAYRYDGRPGVGAPGEITYDEAEPRATRFIGLGHELVHAHRSAHGLGVSPVEVSPQRAAPVLGIDPIVGRAIGHHVQMREEFETVGLTPTPQATWRRAGLTSAPPTENALRQEHQLAPRQDYSGKTPSDDPNIIQAVDKATDDRWLPIRNSPVQRLLHHLED